MAAVAGTKGRVEWSGTKSSSFQMGIVKGLLARELTPYEAAVQIAASPLIREVGVDTNMVCNLSCSYCYLADRHEEKGQLPIDELGGALDSLVLDGAKLFAFIGKEPLADNRALEAMAHLNLNKNRHSFRTGMVTNGTLVTRRLSELLEQRPCYIDISLDGSEAVNDQTRGAGSYRAAIEGVEAIVRSPLQDRLSTTTVLWTNSMSEFSNHVESMFDLGVPTCFGSPVLNFAVSNSSDDISIASEGVIGLIKELRERFPEEDSSRAPRQIMIDLPYKYTWHFLKNAIVPVDEVQEDMFEALFWQVPNSSIVIKLNPFSFSYFRAIRITHDGTVLENMDLAAHTNYSAAGYALDRWSAKAWHENVEHASAKFHEAFIDKHLNPKPHSRAHERELASQFESHLGGSAVPELN